MIITPTTQSVPVNTVTSASPYLLQFYNQATKAFVGPVQYRKSGSVTTAQGILACETYAELQAAAAAAGLVGTLSADPTPKGKI